MPDGVAAKCKQCDGAGKSPPGSRSQLPTIVLTGLLTVVFVCAILAGGYLLYTNFDSLTGLPPRRPPTDIFKVRQRMNVEVSDITGIGLSTETFRYNDPARSPAGLQFLGNISFVNLTLESREITFFSDGKARRRKRRSVYDRDAKPTEQENTEFTGAVTAAQFAELAKMVIDTDFFNLDEDPAEIVPSSLINLTVNSTKGNKLISIGRTGRTSSSLAPLEEAIRNLEAKVGWTPQH